MNTVNENKIKGSEANNVIISSITNNTNKYKFEKVMGHDAAKKEINLLLSWFENKEFYNSKNVKIPKGFILYGEPGNGKSLFIKEIIDNSSIPTKVFHSFQASEITDFFKSINPKEKTILIFDELDLLLDRRSDNRRVFQEGLDGVDSNDNIFVIAACNDIDEIPYPILRQGRLDKHVPIYAPTNNDCLKIFSDMAKKISISFSPDIDEDEIKTALYGSSFVEINYIANEIALRYGFKDITNEQIITAVNFVRGQIVETIDEQKDQLQTAIHEAGHSVMTSTSKTGIKIQSLNITNTNGNALSYSDNKSNTRTDQILEYIKISMAGTIAEKVILGKSSIGCESDLSKARELAYKLVNREGYKSCWRTLPYSYEGNRDVTKIKERKNERKIEAILKKAERETYKVIRKKKDTVLRLAYALNNKKSLTSKQAMKIINNEDTPA